MKNSIKYIVPLVLLLSAGTGCKKELNNAAVNQNQPSTVTPGVQLSSAEAGIAYVIGGDLSRFEGLLDQQMTIGASARQFTNFGNYIFSTTDFNNPWVNLYQNLLNLKSMRAQATAKGYNTYAGIADVLMAQAWGSLTDVYGDIPYTQALLGSGNLQPRVDPQKLVYDSIQGLLDSAIVRLGAATPGLMTPVADDLIYNGDVGKWTRLAHSLKSRYYLHVRKRDPSAVAKAIAEAALGLSANSDDAYVVYGSSSASASPWGQFEQNRAGELSFYNNLSSPVTYSALFDSMYAYNDPRVFGFMDTVTILPNGKPNPTYDMPQSFFGNYVVNNGAAPIMTYAEQLFINAELDMVQTNTIQAATDYIAAVNASVNAFGTGNSSAFLTSIGGETGSTINLQKIMTQKWIALFLNPEAYTDWRRTGYPALTPIAGTAIPRRFYYPQLEIVGNSHVASAENNITLFTRVWWDVQ